MRLSLVVLLFCFPLSVLADIEFIITNSEQALSNAGQGALSVGSVIVLGVAGLITATLILSMLRRM
ncbi:MAG: hypothetical protein RLZZ215_2250 [Pseudomonadota bacterium]|jgi:preprotein translocase subunit SecY